MWIITYVLSIGGGGKEESPRKDVRNTDIITSMLLGQFDCCSRLFTYINLHISMVLGLRMKTDTTELPTFFVFIVSNTMSLNTGCYFILLSLIRPFGSQQAPGNCSTSYQFLSLIALSFFKKQNYPSTLRKTSVMVTSYRTKTCQKSPRDTPTL